MAATEFYVRRVPQGRETGPYDEESARMAAGRALDDPDVGHVEIYRMLPEGGRRLTERVER